MRILVVGGGGKEHAICRKLRESGRSSKLYCVSGNASIAKVAELMPIGTMKFEKIRDFVLREKIDLVMISMGDPLIGGLADFLEEAELKIFGSKKNAAILKGSKTFAKELAKKYEIPTAACESLTDYGAAKRYLETCKIPMVLEVDGPALGKGILIYETRETAEEGLKEMMLKRRFDASGNEVVIEEFVVGHEVSILSSVDGKTIHVMASAQDHKRAKDGDQGLGTGSMGDYSPNPYYTGKVTRFCEGKIYQRTVDAMTAEGRPFQNVIFFGLTLTPDDPRVLGYNVRLSDPEVQAVLPRMENDLLEMILTCVKGKLDGVQLKLCDKACVTVMLANEGYPVGYRKGLPISELENLKSGPDVYCYRTGARFDGEGRVVTNGGRVFDVTALGKTIRGAREKAYAAAKKISFTNKYMRTGIILAGVVAEEVQRV